jgi:hypothetical protein
MEGVKTGGFLLDGIQPESWTHEFTEQLLELLWVLEAVVGLESKQRDLLDRIVAGPVLVASDFARDTPEGLGGLALHQATDTTRNAGRVLTPDSAL